jgi:hypothetical protein
LDSQSSITSDPPKDKQAKKTPESENDDDMEVDKIIQSEQEESDQQPMQLKNEA